jgi:phage antirepressor YoqD-like protein
MANHTHHAIIVTTTSGNAAFAVVDAARERSLETTGVYRSPVNDFYTVAILPDGSGDWRDTSKEYDAKRASFIEWLRQNQCIASGDEAWHSRDWLDWVEVRYGDAAAQVVNEG